MAIPGVFRFGQLNAKPSAPPAGYDIIYVKTDNVLYIQDSAGVEVALGSASVITALTGDVSAVGPGSAVATVNFVGGASAADIAAAAAAFSTATPLDTPNTVVLRDSSGNFAAGTITAALSGNADTATTSISFSGSLSGDVTGTQSATVVSLVGGASASDVAAATATVDAAASSNTASTLVKRDASGNFAANVITASLNGNANTATTSISFSGSLSGDVTGTQAATVVSSVGGASASDIAQSVSDTQAATSSNIASTIVKRNASGSFSANVITASLIGNVTGNVSGSSASFTGTLSGDVSGTQTATSVDKIKGTSVNATAPTDAQFLVYQNGITAYIPVSLSGDATMTDTGAITLVDTSVTSKLLTGYIVGSNIPITASNSILTAFENVQAQINAVTVAAITSLTGDVLAIGPGAAAATVVAIQGFSVSVNTPTDAQILIWNSIAGKWVPESVSGDISMTRLGVMSLVTTTNSTITTLSALSLPGSQVTGNIAGNAANVTGVVAIANGGTGQITANAGFNALSPMTTLGDITYEDATPKAVRLAGNITTTRQFLSQTGTGAISAAPIWAALSSSDIPNNAANTTGTASNITATTNSTLITLTALALPTSQLTGTISLTTQVSGILPIANGGTGQTAANAAFNALSPMTTLGDIIYENATPIAARLPGNITAIRQFLTSQGTGSLATAPTWSALVSGDIPNNAANTTGTASNITATTNTTLTSLPNLAIVGSQVGGFTQGSVIFAGATGTLTQDNANFYWNDTALALGIGVQPASTAVLDIVNNSGSTKAIQVTGYGSNVGFRGRESGGTQASPSPTINGSTLTFFSGRGYGSTAFALASTGVINIVAAATFTDTSMPTYIGFNTTPVGSVTAAEAMRISPAGNLLIGTTTDSGTQKLQVNGNSNVGTVTAGTWNATTIGVGYGGTGLATTPTNGQLLIGNGSGYTLSTITPGTGISIANTAGTITITNSQITALVTKTANYTILSTDGTILCDTSGGAFTLTLPSPSGLSGKLFRVIDSTGFFQTNNLTLAPNGGEKIEGLAASKVLQTPWGWFTITTNGTDWVVGG